tara:strand:- start:1487 stop:1684 length:198 start_codon:yes stop_codon:yes gene_type:complete
MSNHTNEQVLERLLDEVVEQDSKGLLEEEIFTIADNYGLDEDEDRDEILQFIAERIFYNNDSFYI